MEQKLSDIAANYPHYLKIATEYGTSYLIKFIFAVLIYLIGKRVARWLTNAVVKTMRRNDVDVELTGFIESLLYWGLIAIIVVAALGQLGIQTASFIAILGAAGLAIGLALQGSLSNFAAGVLILILRPFDVDDWVDVAGVSGKVRSIKIFTTELLTSDNKRVIIPNSRVLDSNIVNHSSTGTRRVDLVFSISYEDSIDDARRAIEKVVQADERILNSADTQIAVSALAASSVDFVVRPWVRTDDYWDVYFGLTETIKKEFDTQAISIPYPQTVVHRSS